MPSRPEVVRDEVDQMQKPLEDSRSEGAAARILVADPIAAEGVAALRAIGQVDERHGLGR